MVGSSPQMNQSSETAKRTRRRRNFPSTKFEDVLVIAKTIYDEVTGGQLRRLTLFDRLGRSPNSGPSRQFIISSGKYGLTIGGYKAEYLSLTDDGQTIARDLPRLTSSRQLAFQLAIAKFDPFAEMYEKLKNQRLPAEDVLQDQFGQLGIDLADCEKAAQIFDANARYVGVIRDISGSDHLIPIEQLLEDSSIDSKRTGKQPIEDEPKESTFPEDEQSGVTTIAQPTASIAANAPSVHINIQIHIDPNSTPEQIDQIFGSMARHLYEREA